MYLMLFLCYLGYFLNKIFIRKGKRSVSKQGQPQPQDHLLLKVIGHQALNCNMAYYQDLFHLLIILFLLMTFISD